MNAPPTPTQQIERHYNKLKTIMIAHTNKPFIACELIVPREDSINEFRGLIQVAMNCPILKTTQFYLLKILLRLMHIIVMNDVDYQMTLRECLMDRFIECVKKAMIFYKQNINMGMD